MPFALGLCITDLEVGGAERCLTELATRVDRTLYSPTVYCVQPLPVSNELLARLNNSGVEVCSLNARRSIDAWTAIKRLANELKLRKTDVLQTFLYHANIIGRLAARRAGVRKVVSGVRVAEPQRRWRLAIDWATDRLVTRHVCVSRDVADFAASRGKLPRDKLAIIPNGVDAARFQNASPADLTEFGFQPNRRCVLFVGRLAPQKRVDRLLRASAYWMPQHDDTHLLIVGDGRERETLNAIAKELVWSERIHFAGWRSDVPQLLKASNLLVLSSAYEGMPNVVLEAMAAGLPVVATDVQGIRELLESDLQIVPCDDPVALGKRIATLLNDPTLASKLGNSNRQRAQSEFSLDAVVQAYQEVWCPR